jgi:hypothetical protein
VNLFFWGYDLDFWLLSSGKARVAQYVEGSFSIEFALLMDVPRQKPAKFGWYGRILWLRKRDIPVCND